MKQSRIQVTLDAAQENILGIAANQKGLTISAYIRMAALDRARIDMPLYVYDPPFVVGDSPAKRAERITAFVKMDRK